MTMKSPKFKVQNSYSAAKVSEGCGSDFSIFGLRTSSFRRSGFTLVEILVVIAIIGLLLAVLLPAFGAVRNNAKRAATTAQFKALDTGINMFRSEAALGGALPPSASDKPDPVHRLLIANPKRVRNGGPPEVRISGAQLLVHAMIGADALGTPGFKDINRDAQGLWSDDTHDTVGTPGGIYQLDGVGKEKFPRYGGAGYVDSKMKESAKSLRELAEKAVIINLDAAAAEVAKEESAFTDNWSYPILYYRSGAGGIHMTASTTRATQPNGTYWQEDNAIITGSVDGAVGTIDGLDFGAGVVDGNLHDIRVARSPDATATVEAVRETDANFAHSFARFIIDPSVKARPTPVNKDSYLLISAGPDGRYGTRDDVTNWKNDVD